jgi:hypothetical protein
VAGHLIGLALTTTEGREALIAGLSAEIECLVSSDPPSAGKDIGEVFEASPKRSAGCFGGDRAGEFAK